jgi:hypothetical protein
MKLTINKENLRLKANRIAKYSCSGPGKFAVFIILCIIVVATFESLGLTNKERNLDIRKVNNLIRFNIKKHTEEHQERIINHDFFNNQNDVLYQKIKNFSLKNLEEKNLERGKMLLTAAIDQFIYENKETGTGTETITGIDNDIKKINQMSNEEKLNFILSELNSNSLIQKEKKIVVNDEINFFGI